MRITAILGLALATAACVGGPEYIVTEHAVLPVDQAIGLSRVEVSQRLGLKPPVKRLVHIAELEQGVLVETVRNSENNTEGACPHSGFVGIQWRYGDKVGPYVWGEERWSPPAVYHDDRYAGPSVSPARPGDDTSQPAYIVTTCTQAKNIMNPGMLVLLPLVPVHAAIVGAHNATQPGAHDVNPTLATLRLGSPPPGGLDAWLANPPKDARVKSSDAGRTLVTFHSRLPTRADDAYAERVTVTFENGVVTRLEAGLLTNCELTDARAFQCTYGRMPIS